MSDDVFLSRIKQLHLEELLRMQIHVNAEVAARLKGALFVLSSVEMLKMNQADAIEMVLDICRNGIKESGYVK